MSRPETPRARNVRLRSLHRVLTWSVVAVFITACAHTSKQELLEYFFDGVPPLEPEGGPTPEELAPEEPTDPLSILEEDGPKWYRHQPYVEKKCTDCHDAFRGMQVRKVEEGLCSSCHEELTATVPFVHGPVAANACLQCHFPHRSEIEHLLRDQPEALCVRCHAAEDIEGTYHPSDYSTPETTCTACHDPHGGTNGMFLKDGHEPSGN